MFPSKYGFPIMLHNSLILILVLIVICVTTNPLAILGLFFCQQMPIVAGQDEVDTDASAGIGFTADIE
mgnify:CR=1 FL=1